MDDLKKCQCMICNENFKSFAYHLKKIHGMKVSEYNVLFGISVENYSPYSLKYWINKGYSEEDAKYQISIRRPSNINYWINKGYSEEDAKQEVLSMQRRGFDLNSYIKRFGEEEGRMKYEARKSKMLDISPRRVEYWIRLGYSIDDAKLKVSEYQDTRSYKKHIDKYGEEIGIKHVKSVNEKWQSTLKSKSIDEIDAINKKKDAKSIQHLKEKYPENYIELYFSRNFIKNSKTKERIRYIIDNISDIDSFVSYLLNTFENMNGLFCIIDNPLIKDIFSYDSRDDVLTLCFSSDKKINNRSIFGHLYYFDNKLFKSTGELLISRFLVDNSIVYFYDKKYPHTFGKYRYDFYLPDIELYIEYSGMSGIPEYDTNLNRKIQFGIDNEFNIFVSDNIQNIKQKIIDEYQKKNIDGRFL